MSLGSELASLADACRLAPDDPGARAKLIAHCKEAQQVNLEFLNTLVMTLVKILLLKCCRCHLNPHQVSSPLLEALADIARTEEGREAVMVAELLPTLLNRAETHFAGEEMALQACRLGGNLCFDSPQGRRLVEEAGLLRLLTIAVPHLPSPPGKLWQVLPAYIITFVLGTSCALFVSLLRELPLRHLTIASFSTW